TRRKEQYTADEVRPVGLCDPQVLQFSDADPVSGHGLGATERLARREQSYSRAELGVRKRSGQSANLPDAVDHLSLRVIRGRSEASRSRRSYLHHLLLERPTIEPFDRLSPIRTETKGLGNCVGLYKEPVAQRH